MPRNFLTFTITIIVACILSLGMQLECLGEISAIDSSPLTKQGQEAARLLGMEHEIQRYLELKNSGNSLNQEALRLQLAITRKILTAGLELRTTSAKIDKEIVVERQVVDKLTRKRDFILAATNNANFLQLSILSIIIDGPLEESHNNNTVYHGNVLNIVSGLTVGALAGLTILEQKGGTRPNKAPTNMLGQTLGLEPPDTEKLPPLLWTYLNSVSPDSTKNLTRRQQLIEYWRSRKVLSINIQKPKTVERVSALGPHHHKSSETIKLINSRITMLFDLRAMVDLLNTGLVQLLEALE